MENLVAVLTSLPHLFLLLTCLLLVLKSRLIFCSSYTPNQKRLVMLEGKLQLLPTQLWAVHNNHCCFFSTCITIKFIPYGSCPPNWSHHHTKHPRPSRQRTKIICKELVACLKQLCKFLNTNFVVFIATIENSRLKEQLLGDS